MPAHPHPPSVPEFGRIDCSVRAKHESEDEEQARGGARSPIELAIRKKRDPIHISLERRASYSNLPATPGCVGSAACCGAEATGQRPGWIRMPLPTSRPNEGATRASTRRHEEALAAGTHSRGSARASQATPPHCRIGPANVRRPRATSCAGAPTFPCRPTGPHARYCGAHTDPHLHDPPSHEN